MTSHCFLRPIRRDLTSFEFSYTNPKNGCLIDILLFKLKLVRLASLEIRNSLEFYAHEQG